jgi:hypothetical protein
MSSCVGMNEIVRNGESKVSEIEEETRRFGCGSFRPELTICELEPVISYDEIDGFADCDFGINE